MTCTMMCGPAPMVTACATPPRRVHDRKKRFMQGLKGIDPVEKASLSPDAYVHTKMTVPHGGSRILTWLHLGGWQDADDEGYLRAEGITRVLNIAPETQTRRFPGVDYLCISVRDHSEQPISDHFAAAIEFIDTARRAGANVLVHCRQGVSRSATLVVAYIMKALSLPLVLALDVVKQRRSINPNLGFMDALQRFEATLSIATASPLSAYQRVLEEWSLESSLVSDSAPVSASSPSTPQSPRSPPTPVFF